MYSDMLYFPTDVHQFVEKEVALFVILVPNSKMVMCPLSVV